MKKKPRDIKNGSAALIKRTHPEDSLAGAFDESLGSFLDAKDKAKHEETVQKVLQGTLNRPYSGWNNPATRSSGAVAIKGFYRNQDSGRYCKQYTATVIVKGEKHRASGHACKQRGAGNVWDILQEKMLD